MRLRLTHAVIFLGAAFLSPASYLIAAPTLTVLSSFNATTEASRIYGKVALDAAGNVYGANDFGPRLSGGRVFKYDASTGQTTTVALLPDGANTLAGVVMDPTGNLYGTAVFNFGTGYIYKVAADTHAISKVYSFDSPETTGNYPQSNLTLDRSGNLYGTNLNGGSRSGGTVFKYSTTSGTLTTIAAFDGYFVTPNTTAGLAPESDVYIDASGNLYGTTNTGGPNGGGGVYRIAANSNVITPLLNFSTNSSDPSYRFGNTSLGGIVADANGILYGTTSSGGAGGGGTVFSVDPNTGAASVIAAFPAPSGGNVWGTLLIDAAGNLFGETSSGGQNGIGGVYKIDAATRALTIIASFNGTSGDTPRSTLVADAAGNLYGGTRNGGAGQGGTLFKVTDSGFVVPEPSCIALVGLSVITLTRRQRKFV